MKNLFVSVHNHLTQLISLIEQLDDSHYVTPSKPLSNATIGQHTRHIIELFQCLLLHYDEGTLNYDNRKRDKRIEVDRLFAVENIQNILQNIELEDKSLQLFQSIAGIESCIDTNYYRELLYNMEHCIHHQALIKVEILNLGNVALSNDFGVAESTLNKKQLSCIIKVIFNRFDLMNG